MTWHLKDRELEKKLIELYPNFIEDLNFGCMNKGKRYYVTVECTRVKDNGEIPNDMMSFYCEELEEVPEYNPNAWNEFPKVKPPYDVMMRIEFENGEGTKAFYKHCLDGSDYWFGNSRMAFSKNMLINNPIKRFRPWED